MAQGMKPATSTVKMAIGGGMMQPNAYSGRPAVTQATIPTTQSLMQPQSIPSGALPTDTALVPSATPTKTLVGPSTSGIAQNVISSGLGAPIPGQAGISAPAPAAPFVPRVRAPMVAPSSAGVNFGLKKGGKVKK